jgi:hypothetical protein
MYITDLDVLVTARQTDTILAHLPEHGEVFLPAAVIAACEQADLVWFDATGRHVSAEAVSSASWVVGRRRMAARTAAWRAVAGG